MIFKTAQRRGAMGSQTISSSFAAPQGPQFLRNPATLHALEHKHVHLLILAISRLVFESVK